MDIGSGYSVTITNGNSYPSDQCGIWVDWNQDDDFNDYSEIISISGTPGGGPYTATITPPAGANSGNTVMRVRITYTGDINPCGTTQYGEVEDYTINVVDSGDFWLTLNGLPAVNGAVFPGRSEEIITVCYNSSWLTEDTYTAEIQINSNDPDEPEIVIPVILNVEAPAPDIPENIEIFVTGTSLEISWDIVTGANSYRIYASDSAEGTFSLVSGNQSEFSVNGNRVSWSSTVTSSRKFYYVKASTEDYPTRDRNIQIEFGNK